jgi:hypothetical protein
MTSLSTIIAAPASAAASPLAGAMVWWRLSGDVSVACITQALASTGIVPPAAPTEEAALKRALGKFAKGGRKLARKMDERGRRLAVVREMADAGQDDLDYDVEIRATLEQNSTGGVSLVTRPYTSEIHDAYEAAKITLTSDDIGLWLVRSAAVRADAVSLREGGGVYFVPAHGLQAWRAVWEAIRSCAGHKAFEIPAFADDDSAVEGILDSLTQAVATGLAQIEAKAEEGLGERAAETQRKRVEDLRARVARYEGVLGAKATHLHEACDRLAAHEAFNALAGIGGNDPFGGLSFPSLA